MQRTFAPKIMNLKKPNRLFLVTVVAFVLVFSGLLASPLGVMAAQPSSPSLKSITFVDYGGNDASGVADLQANKIDAYDFSLTPSASSSLGSSFNQYVAPSSLYGLYVNPQNITADTGNFNPFYYQEVRFALNYLIDRSYFGQTIEGGFFLPSISAVSAEPDTLNVAGAMAPFSNVTFNFQFANQTIYNTLSQVSGITYTNHQYYYNGKAVNLGLFDRVDDPIRHSFMQYLNSQLQKVGFQTTLIPGDLSKAYSVIFGADPANATWVVYPASNSQIWGYYDSNAINFYSDYYFDLPASDHYGPNWIGGWDNTTEQTASVALWDKADTFAIPLLNSNFSTIAQRNSLLANLSYYGVLGATYICLGTSLAPYAASSAVSGVTPNFLQDPFANYQNFMSMSVSGSGASGSAGNLKLGVRHITNGAVNPGGGDDDAYSNDMQQAGAFPLIGYGPSTGYPYSTGMTYTVQANSFKANTPVPTTALWFNGSSDKWANVTSGQMAQDQVTVDFSQIFSHTTWGDGQPVNLADLLTQYTTLAQMVSPNSPLYDAGGEHGLYSTDYGQVQGIKVLNSTALTIWTQNTFFPDANEAAVSAILDVASPLGYAGYTNGLGMTPWQMYYAMNQVVANGQAAWSTATAGKKSIPWLSLLNPTDVSHVKTALSSAGSTIPPEISQLQTMTGVTWVNSTTASAGYQAAINFINTNGVAVISDGPFYISQYSASTSPAYLVMKPNPGFNAGSIGNSNLFAPAVVLTPNAAIPPVLSAGGSFTINVVQTPDGSNSSTPAGNATVLVQLVSNGTTTFSQTYQSDSSGNVQVQLPSSLSAGTYLLSIYAHSTTSALVKPVVQSLTLTGGSVSSTNTTSNTGSVSSTTTNTGGTSTTSTTSSTSTPTTSSGPSTTPGTDYTLIAAVVVVIIIIAVAAVLVIRRR